MGFISLFEVSGQIDMRTGFIILNNGDTISGEIDYRNDLYLGSQCAFRYSQNNEIVKYGPNDIQAYRFTDGRFFISKEVPFNEGSSKVFLEYLVNGKLNIYYLRDELKDRYYFEKEGENIVELPYDEGIKYDQKTNNPYFYRSVKHINLLTYYLQDAPELKSKINKLNKPDHINLIRLSESYQNVVCKDENCIVYERKLPFLKLAIEPVFGIVKYFNATKAELEYGGLLYIWMPRTNEWLYFKTGFLKQSVNGESFDNIDINNKYELFSVIRIPFQLQYIYPSGKIKPLFSIGYNFYSVKSYLELGDVFRTQGHFLNIGTGLSFLLKENIFFNLNMETDMTTILSPVLSGAKFSFLSYSIHAGLNISL